MIGYYEVELRGIASSAVALKQDQWNLADGTNRGKDSCAIWTRHFRSQQSQPLRRDAGVLVSAS